MLKEPLPALDVAVLDYLHGVLGIRPKIKPWSAGKLPYYLQDAFELRELRLLDRPILLAIERHPNKPPALAVVRGQLGKLKAATGLPVAYVTGALASYERKRLIEQKVPFIVPGNQLYLPELGIDLREYFRQRPEAPQTALSPATQAVLIAALLRKPWQPDWDPGEIVARLGYTPMTLSRAVKEITAAGIAVLQVEGRVRRLHMPRPPADTWELAKPLLRDPVKRRVWVHPIPRLKPRIRVAGLAALALLTSLTEPEWPIYAVGPEQWKAIAQDGIDTLPERMANAWEMEVWHYDPALLPDVAAVDPLSLTLSLREEADERVQIALDELKEHFPW